MGDPIELGAASAVLCTSSVEGADQTLSLMAGKSWSGHAEPAAGIVGALHAAAALRFRVDLPLMHLGRLNDHVIGALAATASSAKATRASRQAAPRPQRRPEAEVAGISAFAFQVRTPSSAGGIRNEPCHSPPH